MLQTSPLNWITNQAIVIVTRFRVAAMVLELP